VSGSDFWRVGYGHDFAQNIERIAASLEKISKALERIDRTLQLQSTERRSDDGD